MKIRFKSSEVVFTSDTHFGHANIIKYCDRPFEFPETVEMDMIMMGGFMDYDALGKTLIHLGDFVFNPSYVRDCGWRPGGKHILILGNHDRYANDGGQYRSLYQEFFTDILGTSYEWRTFSKQIWVDDIPILLSHEPQRDLKGCKYNIYGHHHNNMIRDPARFSPDYDWLFGSLNHINVGVELTEYRPVSFSEALNLPRPEKPLK